MTMPIQNHTEDRANPIANINEEMIDTMVLLYSSPKTLRTTPSSVSSRSAMTCSLAWATLKAAARLPN